MTTLDQVRTGLKTQLTFTGVQTWAMIPDAIEPPAILIPPVPTATSYFGDLDTAWWEVVYELAVMVSSATDENQLDLVPFLERSGPLSIFATLMADTSLGGLDVEAKPNGMRLLGKTQIGDVFYYGAAVTVNAIVKE